MAINQSFGGSTYSIPTTGDLNWGNNLTRYLIALGTFAISPAGGLYTLTADLNFGPTFGLLTHYVTSTTSTPATAGELRLAKTDTIEWRNNANSADNILAVNGSDQLTYNGTVINGGALTPTIVGTPVALTGQNANIGPIHLITGAATGLYRVNIVIYSTAGDGTAGTVTPSITYSNPNPDTYIQAANGASLAAQGNVGSTAMVIDIVNSSTITLNTGNSGTYGTATYSIYVTLEKLF